MITNQFMLRKMGDFEVIQRTGDSFFNATRLLKEWNLKSGIERKMDNYFNSEKTKEFINTIMDRENLHTPKMVYVKSRASRGDKSGTWMSPILFLDFAMYINPSFKYDAIRFIYDKMIEYRNKAGDAYKLLATNVQKVVDANFMPIAMRRIGEAINWIIFNCHEKDLRNKFGSEEKQNELYQFEIKVATLIDEGFITSYDELIKYLRSQYARRNKPF